ncbi:MAG: hypothetical protein AAF467_21265 [Actinomycetota bacterium]
MFEFSDQFFWYATRSAGLLLWAASAASVIVGLLMPTRLLGRRPTIPWLLDLHRYLGSLTVVLLVIHVVTLRLDPFVAFTWRDVLVPGAAQVSGLSGLSLAYGVVAGWIIVVVQLTSVIKDQMPESLWHSVHMLSLAALGTGTIHAVDVGSDTDNVVALAAAVSLGITTIVLLGFRISRYLEDRRIRYEAFLAEIDEF